jgi:hypothetical protein
MLAEIETGLVALVRQSPLGPRLRAVDALPDLSGESLIGRFSTDAPAIYVSLGAVSVQDGALQIDCGVACVARNARGPKSARHGDTETLGLLPMLDAALAVLDGARVGGGTPFYATGIDLLHDDMLYQRGVHVGVLRLRATDIPIESLDESALADFVTFHADYDIDPHDAAFDHDKWLQEPPDHSTSAPDLSDQLNLQEPKP